MDTNTDKLTERFNQRMKEGFTNRFSRFQKEFFWTLYTLPNGQRVIDGPVMSEEEATNQALQKTNTKFKVFKLGTRDKAHATSMIKHMIAQESNDLPDAIKRVKHKI